MDLFKCLARIGKQPLRIATAFSSLMCAQQCFAQIPVTVTSQVTESPMTIAEFASNSTRWSQQVQQMASQIDQMKQQ